MSLIEVLLLAVGLAIDASAVSLGIGAARRACGPRPQFRLSFHFGLFQGLMPILGWWLGSQVAPLIASVDHWVAMGLLTYVGVQMIRSGLDHDGESYPCDPSRGRTLVMLCIATSIDALAVGLSMGLLEVSIWAPCLVIGLVAATFTTVGILGGSRLGRRWGRAAETAGGCVLLAIGVKVLADHLLS